MQVYHQIVNNIRLITTLFLLWALEYTQIGGKNKVLNTWTIKLSFCLELYEICIGIWSQTFDYNNKYKNDIYVYPIQRKRMIK